MLKQVDAALYEGGRVPLPSRSWRRDTAGAADTAMARDLAVAVREILNAKDDQLREALDAVRQVDAALHESVDGETLNPVHDGSQHKETEEGSGGESKASMMDSAGGLAREVRELRRRVATLDPAASLVHSDAWKVVKPCVAPDLKQFLSCLFPSYVRTSGVDELDFDAFREDLPPLIQFGRAPPRVSQTVLVGELPLSVCADMPDWSGCRDRPGAAAILYTDDRFFGNDKRCVPMQLWNRCLSRYLDRAYALGAVFACLLADWHGA